MRGLSEQRAGSRSYSTQSLGPEEPTYRATPQSLTCAESRLRPQAASTRKRTLSGARLFVVRKPHPDMKTTKGASLRAVNLPSTTWAVLGTFQQIAGF